MLKIHQRNFGLDLLRAISIWLVLLQHAGLNISGLAPLKIGAIGVEMFFVLSGFLIGGILFKALSKNEPFIKTIFTFWIRRWFRILPLYYLVLAFKYCFIDSSIGTNIFYYIFFLQNNFYGIDYLHVSWSLVIEEWFYLFSPLFLFVLTRLFEDHKKVVVGMLVFIGLVVLARTLYVLILNTPYSGINANFPFRFDSLFLGVLLAYLKRYFTAKYKSLQHPFICLSGLLLCLVYLLYYHSLSSVSIELINQELLPRTLGFFILPLSFALVLPYASTLKAKTSTLFYKFITYTSLFTYAIYLVHGFVFHQALKGDIFIVEFSLSIAITYLIAWVLYRFYEKPILGIRDRLF